MKHNVGTLLGVLGVTTVATLVGVGEAKAITFIDDFGDKQKLISDGTEGFGSDGRINRDASPASINIDTNIFGDTDRTLTILEEFTFAAGTSDELTVTTKLEDGSGTRIANNRFSTLEEAGSETVAQAIYTGDAAGDFSSVTGFSFDVVNDNGTNVQVDLFDNSDNIIAQAYGVNLGEGRRTINLNNSPDDVYEARVTINAEGKGIAGGIQSSEPVPFNTQSWVGLALLGTWGTWKYWKKRNQCN